MAHHTKTQKQVCFYNLQKIAIKLIKKENIQNPVRKEKLLREIDILKSVNHRYIVKLWEVIETEGYIGMAMEYAAGMSLHINSKAGSCLNISWQNII